VAPVVVERITDAQGKPLFEAPPAGPLTPTSRVVPARNVFLTNSLLNDVARYGTAARAQAQLGRGDLYGKTGTTNDAVDAWFAGFQAGEPRPGGGGVDGPRRPEAAWARANRAAAWPCRCGWTTWPRR
jgi:penicillin-binding protein 1A